jgi:homoserine dehydrogenase
VSANKGIVGDFLDLAEGSGRLRYSAAVGGSVPMIEAVDREAARGEITAIAGIVNGTCNYVLDRVAAGASFAEAMIEAHRRGFAEADPTEDLSGRDSERKLRILARHAFGTKLTDVAVEELSASSLARARQALRPRETLRFVARAERAEGRTRAHVGLVAYENSHPFAQTHAEWNSLTITRSRGEQVMIRGRGAGRWPTTEAVMADLSKERFARLEKTA